MTRPNPYLSHANLIQPMTDLGNAVQTGLDPRLAYLVRIRASQINGCTASLFNNVKLAREAGESEDRILLLPAWRRSPLFSARERAALAWTEALTLVSQAGAPETLFEELRSQFAEEEMVRLTMMIALVNGFNRIGIGFGVGHPPVAASKAA